MLDWDWIQAGNLTLMAYSSRWHDFLWFKKPCTNPNGCTIQGIVNTSACRPESELAISIERHRIRLLSLSCLHSRTRYLPGLWTLQDVPSTRPHSVTIGVQTDCLSDQPWSSFCKTNLSWVSEQVVGAIRWFEKSPFATALSHPVPMAMECFGNYRRLLK